MLIQAERLRAVLLARAGNWPATEALFARALERAAGLDLPFEAARTQAALAATAMRDSPALEAGQAPPADRLRQAQGRLDQYDAGGDLANLAWLQEAPARVTPR